MKTRNQIFLLFSFDVVYCYICPPTKLQRKTCIEPILHCLPIYPDWNDYEIVCSNAKTFVAGTCPVLLKRNITSVPCPAMYYTDTIYRSNQIDIPKLKRNCTEEGQLTYITKSTLNNLCYCGEDYLEDFPLPKKDRYCDPTSNNCSCHRKTTDDINKDEGSDLRSIYIPVVAVFSILAFVSITGFSLKRRNRQNQESGERDRPSRCDVTTYSDNENRPPLLVQFSVLAKSEADNIDCVTATDTCESMCDSTQHITESKEKEERNSSQENIYMNVNAQVPIKQERRSIQETQGERDTPSRGYDINDRRSEERPSVLVSSRNLAKSRDNTNRENNSEEPYNMDLPPIVYGTTPLNISVIQADKVLQPSLGNTNRV